MPGAGSLESSPGVLGQTAHPTQGAGGQCTTFLSLWVFSLAEPSFKALESPYFLWDFGRTHDPKASCYAIFFFRIFSITDRDVMFSVSKRLHTRYDGSRVNSFLAFGLIYQLNNKCLPLAVFQAAS